MSIDSFLSKSVRDTANMLDACSGSDLGLPEVAEAVRKTTGLLESLGHHVTPGRPSADIPMMMRAWTDIVAVGTALWINARLKGRPLTDDLVEGVSIGAIAHAETLAPTRYLQAINEIHAFGRQMAHYFASSPDILLSAALAEPPARVGRFAHTTTDYLNYRIGPDCIFANSPVCPVFNASGQPAASLPLAMSSRALAIGIQLAAPYGQDEDLIAPCAELETAQHWAAVRPAMTLA